MQIIEIEALDNGAHRNQSGNFKKIPDGWALVPDDMVLDNFPFGVVKARKIKGIKTVTSWEASPIPEITEITEVLPTVDERLKKIESVFEKIIERFNIYDN